MIEPRLHVPERQCWCEPRLKWYAHANGRLTGRMLVIHDDASWVGQWGVFEFEEDGDVVVAPTPWDKDQSDEDDPECV